MKRTTIFALLLTAFFGLAQAQDTTANPEHVQSVTAISRVLGDGRKVETVVLGYDTPITRASLPRASRWKARK